MLPSPYLTQAPRIFQLQQSLIILYWYGWHKIGPIQHRNCLHSSAILRLNALFLPFRATSRKRPPPDGKVHLSKYHSCGAVDVLLISLPIILTRSLVVLPVILYIFSVFKLHIQIRWTPTCRPLPISRYTFIRDNCMVHTIKVYVLPYEW